MIKVNIAEIEQITDTLVKAASNSEEVFNRLRLILSEMQDDFELSAYPQTPFVLESVSMAQSALNRGNDTLQSLRNVMQSVADHYQETELKNKAALNRMAATMDRVSVGYHAAVVSDSIAHMEHDDTIVFQNKIQQLVAQSSEEMQLTNIAAITKTVQEEYEIIKIEDLVEKG